jgi:DNA polymerase-3 subunit alpha
MYLIFDTETTGLPKRWGAPISDTDNWPRCIQIAWQLHDAMGNLLEHQDYLINPEGFNIPYDAEKVHGISTEFLMDKQKFHEIALEFVEFIKDSTLIIHNAKFDVGFLNYELSRLSHPIISFDNVVDTLAMARKKHTIESPKMMCNILVPSLTDLTIECLVAI